MVKDYIDNSICFLSASENINADSSKNGALRDNKSITMFVSTNIFFQ
jgi:hypothetical protein